MKVIKELAEDDYAYRSLTLSWFEHSPLREILKKILRKEQSLLLLLIMEQLMSRNQLKSSETKCKF